MENRLFHSYFDPETQTVKTIPFSDEEMIQYERLQVVMEYNALTGNYETRNDYTEEDVIEYRAKIVELKWNKFREKRNQLLADSDYMVLPDLWETYSDTKKAEFSAYRQALRDLPSTITDIDNIIYPQVPSRN